MGNAGALERVLANLLTNAAKFSPSDSRIVVSVRRAGDVAVLEVADHGAGIAAEDRERVFARFYRGESDAARATRGAGIGLSVVRELVLQMGGTVVALPNDPQGTRMIVRLPLEDAASVVAPPVGAGHLQAERSAT
jgi:signal transduction histidine kinase